jgi:hypothetical protein
MAETTLIYSGESTNSDYFTWLDSMTVSSSYIHYGMLRDTKDKSIIDSCKNALLAHFKCDCTCEQFFNDKRVLLSIFGKLPGSFDSSYTTLKFNYDGNERTAQLSLFRPCNPPRDWYADYSCISILLLEPMEIMTIVSKINI